MGDIVGSGLSFEGEILYLLLDPSVDGDKNQIVAGAPPTAML